MIYNHNFGVVTFVHATFSLTDKQAFGSIKAASVHDATITLNTTDRNFNDVRPSAIVTAYKNHNPLPHLDQCIDALDAIFDTRTGTRSTSNVTLSHTLEMEVQGTRSTARGSMHTGVLNLRHRNALLSLGWPVHQVSFTTSDKRFKGTLHMFGVPDSWAAAASLKPCVQLHAQHFATQNTTSQKLHTPRNQAIVPRTQAQITCTSHSPSHATVRKQCVDAHKTAIRAHGLTSCAGQNKFTVHDGILSVHTPVHDGVDIVSVFAKVY